MAAAEVGLKGDGGGMGLGRRRGRLQLGKLGFFLFICSIIGGLGEGKMGCWQAGPDSCLRPGRFRAAPIGPCLGPARHAGVAAQALKDYPAVPALSTIDRASGRAWTMLFRIVFRAANRDRPVWNSAASPHGPVSR
jgi:hypothetical protein